MDIPAFSLRRILRVLTCIAIGLFLGISGCASIEQQYAGYKVIDKDILHGTRKVPVRVTSCVTPRGQIVCERRYGAFDECSLQCKTPENTWIERPKGYGGYEDKPFTEYYLVLQSPSGSVEKKETNEQQFRAAVVGQTVGASARVPSPAPVTRSSTQGFVGVDATRSSDNSSQSTHDPESAKSVVRTISVSDAQSKLNSLGFDVGLPDGLAGSRTVRAIRTFQASRKIAVSGKLDQATISELFK